MAQRVQEQASLLAAIAEELEGLGIAEQQQWAEARRLLEAAFRAVEAEEAAMRLRGAA